MKVSLRLILIPFDAGVGQSVRPLAQQELALFEIEERTDPNTLTMVLARAAQVAVRPLLGD